MKDLHQIWSHRWTSPKIKCRNSSIHGLGAFAVKDIKKDEIVVILGGVVVPVSDIKKYRKKLGHVGIQINDDFFVCPTTHEELLKGVFNHSCNPNVGLLDPITYIAIRNIKKGEEIVLDYAFCETFMDDFKCNCNSPNCRKVITGNDWKNRDIQEKYEEFFSPYLRSKI